MRERGEEGEGGEGEGRGGEGEGRGGRGEGRERGGRGEREGRESIKFYSKTREEYSTHQRRIQS